MVGVRDHEGVEPTEGIFVCDFDQLIYCGFIVVVRCYRLLEKTGGIHVVLAVPLSAPFSVNSSKARPNQCSARPLARAGCAISAVYAAATFLFLCFFPITSSTASSSPNSNKAPFNTSTSDSGSADTSTASRTSSSPYNLSV